jgi:hypothetical protein
MKSLLLIAGLVAVFGLASQAGGPSKVPSMPYPPRDAERPLPLPVISKYEPEKTGKNDPVAEASQGMVKKVIITQQPQPAPFVRTVEVDPFENRNFLRGVKPVPEEGAPPLVLPRK